jgi:hypothetical protein
LKVIARISFLILSVCLLAASSFAQKQEQPAAVSGKTICKSEKVPAGYKIVGETSEARCPDGAWIIRTRNAQASLNPEIKSPAPSEPVVKKSARDKKLSGEDYPDAADALKALRKMAGATYIGITLDEYSSRLIDLNSSTREAVARLPKGKLRTEIASALDAYLDAQRVLEEMRRNRFTFIYAEGLGADLMNKYSMEPVRNGRGRAILPRQLILNAIWNAANDHVRAASALLED